MASLAHYFEKLIWYSRLLIIIAVIAGLISALIMVGLGAVMIGTDFIQFLHVFGKTHALETANKILIINAVSAMDTFLIGTVLLIFSIGLYELFVQRIAAANTINSKALVVKNLDQLKEKLAKVILMVLFVTFFKYAITLTYSSIKDLLFLALSILIIAIAMFLSRLKLS